jgi:hypothetical protein
VPARTRPGSCWAWARAWPDRTWAAGGAAGLGHLLAQQLVAAGERVLDIQPKLAEFNAELQVGRAMDCPEELPAWNHSPGLRDTRKLRKKAGRDRLAWPGSSGRSRGR